MLLYSTRYKKNTKPRKMKLVVIYLVMNNVVFPWISVRTQGSKVQHLFESKLRKNFPRKQTNLADGAVWSCTQYERFEWNCPNLGLDKTIPSPLISCWPFGGPIEVLANSIDFHHSETLPKISRLPCLLMYALEVYKGLNGLWGKSGWRIRYRIIS